ncbi:uncharacterized protein LOC114540588 [Dendronephthya gigantea]|uniref:uncharacterized protein LOC114540588 n=1 Tax=Dendronephthya gigantea TaxID=151771 RepID=UPI0010691359|nr:uncharacterized protein LOC114540588 [Dendronephthya gigantea]
MSFYFQYSRPNKKPRSVRIISPYFKYMYDCVSRICEERELNKKENVVFPSAEESDEKDGELSSSTEKTKDEEIESEKPRKSSKKPKSRKAPKVISQDDVANIDNDDL